MKIPKNKRPVGRLCYVVQESKSKNIAQQANNLMKKKHWTRKDLRKAHVLYKVVKNNDYSEYIPKKNDYYLYVIQQNDKVKIGFSSNVDKRLGDLQVSSPTELKLLHKKWIASDKREALKNEDNIHDMCRKYHVRGEWFTTECLPIFKDYRPLLTQEQQEEIKISMEMDQRI